MLPTVAPAAAPVTPPARLAVELMLRLYDPMPPALIIQLATVGMVKYPIIPIIINIM